jgi:hypothetical protein
MAGAMDSDDRRVPTPARPDRPPLATDLAGFEPSLTTEESTRGLVPLETRSPP